jgi:hypothetical protein
MKSRCVVTSLLLIALPITRAEEAKPSEEAILGIRADLLVARVPQGAAIELQKAFHESADTRKPAGDLLKLISTGKGELIDWPVLLTRSGNRAVAENIEEVRYPIEFQQPQVVVPAPVPLDRAEVAEPTAPNPAEGSKNPPKDKKAPDALVVLGGVPTTFETRNVGVTLEMEPVIADRNTVDAQFSAQHTAVLGYRKHRIEVEGKYAVVVEKPNFETQKVSTNFAFTSGRPHLLSFKKSEISKGSVELMVLTVTVVEMGKRPTGVAPSAQDLLTDPTVPAGQP